MATPVLHRLCIHQGLDSSSSGKKRLLILSAAILIITIPFAYFGILNEVPELRQIAWKIGSLTVKSEMGILRYIHFLALAYVAWAAVGEGGHRLLLQGFGGKVVRVIKKVGQQSLAVFLASLILAQGIAVFRDELGLKGTLSGEVMANLLGFVGLIAVAYAVAWFKGQPWKKAREPRAS